MILEKQLQWRYVLWYRECCNCFRSWAWYRIKPSHHDRLNWYFGKVSYLIYDRIIRISTTLIECVSLSRFWKDIIFHIHPFLDLSYIVLYTWPTFLTWILHQTAESTFKGNKNHRKRNVQNHSWSTSCSIHEWGDTLTIRLILRFNQIDTKVSTLLQHSIYKNPSTNNNSHMMIFKFNVVVERYKEIFRQKSTTVSTHPFDLKHQKRSFWSVLFENMENISLYL